jgi:hypothetical protein
MVSPKTGAVIATDAVGDYIWWPTFTQIKDLAGNPGKIYIGDPPNGDFASAPGVSYVSPGYRYPSMNAFVAAAVA